MGMCASPGRTGGAASEIEKAGSCSTVAAITQTEFDAIKRGRSASAAFGRPGTAGCLSRA
jgi:hypothetical protein